MILDLVILRKESRGVERSDAGTLCAAGAAGGAPARHGQCAGHQQCRELRALNHRFRGKNKATDVLSFPSVAGPESGKAKRVAGDVAISADIARENAVRLGHSAAEEVKILALHGILHLAGFDHERDNGEMARKEAELRR